MSYRDEVSLSMLASTTSKGVQKAMMVALLIVIIKRQSKLYSELQPYMARMVPARVRLLPLWKYLRQWYKSFVNENVVKHLSRLYYDFNINNAQAPCMQMIFICNGERYRYGFEVFQGKVFTEWLVYCLRAV